MTDSRTQGVGSRGRTRRNAVLAAGGGLGWAAVPALDGVGADYADLAVLVPVLLGFGVLELRAGAHALPDRRGRLGTLLAGGGLALLLLAAVLRATVAIPVVGAFLVGLPAVAGLVVCWLGSVLLAVSLYERGVVDGPLALAFGLAMPASPLVDAAIAPALGFGVGLYGLAWVALAAALVRTDPDHGEGTRVGPAGGRRRALPIGPQALVAGLVAPTLLGQGVTAFAPLGPLSELPFVGNALALDVAHLLAGTLGVVAALPDGTPARA